MERKKDIREVEYYLNGKLFKTCPHNQWSKVDDQIKNMLRKNKYVHNYSEEYMNRLPHTWEVYVLPEKYKVIVVSHKVFTGHYDKKGNKIYEGDKVRTPYGFDSWVNGHWGEIDKYYVRQDMEWMKWKDYDIDNWTQFEKIEDVIKTPKKFWNESETCGNEILK